MSGGRFFVANWLARVATSALLLHTAACLVGCPCQHSPATEGGPDGGTTSAETGLPDAEPADVDLPDRPDPRCTAGPDCPVQLSAGAHYACVIRADGSVWCWGHNLWGQLGDGTVMGRSEPQPVDGVDDAVDLATGRKNACAVVADGRVLCWGDNEHGQLGDGTFTSRRTPAPVVGLDDAVAVDGNVTMCALREDGTVACWGHSRNGELLDDTLEDEERNRPVELADLSGVRQVSVGTGHVCALVEDGRVLCWGSNRAGWLGLNPDVVDGALSPQEIPELGRVVYLAARTTDCAVEATGRVKCWGAPLRGDGTAERSQFPERVAPLEAVASVTSGTGGQRCALRDDGALWCWGRNGVGQLGTVTGDFAVYGPVQTAGPGFAVQVDAGGLFTCALRSSGQVLCWGDNTDGQLGRDAPSESVVPLAVQDIP